MYLFFESVKPCGKKKVLKGLFFESKHEKEKIILLDKLYLCFFFFLIIIILLSHMIFFSPEKKAKNIYTFFTQ